MSCSSSIYVLRGIQFPRQTRRTRKSSSGHRPIHNDRSLSLHWSRQEKRTIHQRPAY